MTTVEAPAEAHPVEQLVGRMFGSGVGAIELCNAYLGIHLGLYRALDAAAASPAELADRTGCDARYLREWLQAQAIGGFVIADGDDLALARFTLAEGVADVLVHETAPSYLGGLPDALAAAASVLPKLLEAYRSGAGVPYAAYGRDAVSAQAALNRPSFVNSFVDEWLPQLPDVQARLRDADRPAVVADLGCGMGWAGIELAKAFPHIQVEGRDNDEASIALGRQRAVDSGVADQVTLEVVDVSDPAADWSPRYDFAFFVECVHDFPRPAEALQNARRALRPGGSVLVVDERVDETLTTPGDEVQRFFAAASAIWCLPQGRVGNDPQPIGAVIRPDTMRNLATRAGYSSVDIVPIEHPFWRFYRLAP